MGKQLVTIFGMDQGINNDIAPPFLPDRQSPMLANVIFDLNTVKQIPGRKPFGPDSDLGDSIYHLVRFHKLDGSEYLIACTLSKTWRYNPLTPEWVDLSVEGEWAGDEDNIFTSCLAMDANTDAPLGDIIVLHNQVNDIRYWDQLASGNTILLPGDSSTYSPCTAVRYYADKLILFGVTEGGNWYSSRCVWSNPGDVQTFNAYSFVDLVQTTGSIVTAEALGSSLIVYKDDGIIRCDDIGGDSTPAAFIWALMVSGLGVRGARTVGVTQGLHFFLGSDYNVYAYNGTNNATPVGNVIQRELQRRITPETENRAFGFVIPHKQEYHLVVPENRSHPDSEWIYDYRHNTWTYANYFQASLRGCTAYAIFKETTDETWDDIPLTWTWNDYDPSHTWQSFATSSNADFVVMGDETGKVSLYDYISVNDRDTAIGSYWETKDIIPDKEYLHNYKTWWTIEFEGKGDSVTVEYQADGADWITVDSVSMYDEFRSFKLPMMVTAKKIRLRFSNYNLSETWHLRALQLEYSLRSDV